MGELIDISQKLLDSRVAADAKRVGRVIAVRQNITTLLLGYNEIIFKCGQQLSILESQLRAAAEGFAQADALATRLAEQNRVQIRAVFAACEQIENAMKANMPKAELEALIERVRQPFTKSKEV